MTSSVRNPVRERKILNLTAEVAEAPDSVVPRLLVQLQDIPHTKENVWVKEAVWTKQLLKLVLLALKQDFTRILEGWKTVTKLADILSNYCVGLDPPEQHEFYDVFLPDVNETLLILARKMQNKYIKTSAVLEDSKAEALENFRSVLDSLAILFTGHNFLVEQVLKSPWLLQILITDDSRTTVSIMNMIQVANRQKRGVFGDLETTVVHSILDEVIYKLSASSDGDVGGAATRTVLSTCDSYKPALELIGKRYKGLRPLLNRWANKGFGPDLRRLQMLLEAGNMQEAEMKKYHEAAKIIQAIWRSRSTRNSLKRANTAIGKFQRSFRSRKEQEQRQNEEQKMQSELRHMLLMKRKSAMRHLHQRQLDTLLIMPAGDVEKHLMKQETDAAMKIQAQVRGWQARRQLSDRQNNMKKVRAAIRIQRLVRKWLGRIASRRNEPPIWQRPPGLNDVRRVELQGEISEWRELHQVKTEGDEARKDLHDRVQDMLRANAIRSKVTRKQEHHRKALLAQIEMDANLLSDSPKLSDVTDEEIDPFVCHSIPLATKARHDHQEEIRLLQRPWYRKLGDNYQDSRAAEEQEGWKIF